jgi:hypothetical protein
VGEHRLAAVEGVAGLWLSVETNTPPGAAISVVAGAGFRGGGGGAGVIAEASQLSAGYNGRVALSGVSVQRRGGRAAGGARAQRRRQGQPCSASCSASCRRARARYRCARAARRFPQTDRSRLDFPVSALDVALMGSLARLPWWRRPGRADRRGRARL